MDTNQITKQYEASVEASKRMKNVIEQLGRLGGVPDPTTVRADSLYWTGRDGVTAQVVVEPDRTNFFVLGNQAHPGFLASVDSSQRLADNAPPFRQFSEALQVWGIGAYSDLLTEHAQKVQQGQNQNR